MTPFHRINLVMPWVSESCQEELREIGNDICELLVAVNQAQIQLDMASECIEMDRLDEARMHVNAMRGARLRLMERIRGPQLIAAADHAEGKA